MDPSHRRLIEALHQAPVKYTLAVTGGGAGAAALLLNVPGGSRTVLEVVVPYQERACVEYLGHRPANFCSTATAQEMAARALERARWLAPGEAVLGVGCTASLATDRPKRGDHRFHVAVHRGDQVTTHTLTLLKGARDRAGEEAVLDAVLLNAMAAACGIAERVAIPLLPGEEVVVETTGSPDLLLALLRGEIAALCAEVDGRLRTDAPPPAALLPGAFNPVHAGHWGMAAAAARRTGRSVAFELSVVNVDKPPLAAEEVRKRVGQFTWRAPLWITRAPTFAEKAALFRGVLFVVGADTAGRIVAARYYQDSEALRDEALAGIRAQGCRFLVAGRADAMGEFVGLEGLHLPPAHSDLFEGIPQKEFELAISSSQLRELQQR
jgi:nicotinamide mononucleotide (NMN) deamidase PncC